MCLRLAFQPLARLDAQVQLTLLSDSQNQGHCSWIAGLVLPVLQPALSGCFQLCCTHYPSWATLCWWSVCKPRQLLQVHLPGLVGHLVE